MELAAIIGIILKTGPQAVSGIIHLINDLKGEPPTQAQIDSFWARHQSAYADIMMEDPDTHAKD